MVFGLRTEGCCCITAPLRQLLNKENIDLLLCLTSTALYADRGSLLPQANPVRSPQDLP